MEQRPPLPVHVQLPGRSVVQGQQVTRPARFRKIGVRIRPDDDQRTFEVLERWTRRLGLTVHRDEWQQQRKNEDSESGQEWPLAGGSASMDCHELERATGFEPATKSLGSSYSTN